jgi:hypothetical protein
MFVVKVKGVRAHFNIFVYGKLNTHLAFKIDGKVPLAMVWKMKV